MRRILNLFIIGLILWGANQLCPEIVQIDSFTTLILASVLLWLVNRLVIWAAVASMVILPIFILVSIVAICFSQVIAMYILSAHLTGFAVVGFWPKVLIAMCYSMLALGDDTSSNSNTSN